MAHDSTIHIKVDKEMAEGLKQLARQRNKSQGQLVREAISSCYQISFAGLNKAQQHALSAYQGGFIGLGRLAEIMGMHVLELRDWLMEHSIPENACFTETDTANA